MRSVNEILKSQERTYEKRKFKLNKEDLDLVEMIVKAQAIFKFS